MSTFLVNTETDDMAGAPFVQTEIADGARRRLGACSNLRTRTAQRPQSQRGRVRLALFAAAALVAAATGFVASEIVLVTQAEQARGVMDGE
jgi:hypothetical protein